MTTKTLKEIMTPQVSVTSPDASLMEAAQLMDDLNIGDLPVCERDRMVGIITDRDMVIRSISAGQDPKLTRVRDAMTAPVIYIHEDASLNDAAQLMEKHQIRRLPIINDDKRLVGIVSLGDIAVHLRGNGISGEILQKVSEPSGRAA